MHELGKALHAQEKRALASLPSLAELHRRLGQARRFRRRGGVAPLATCSPQPSGPARLIYVPGVAGHRAELGRIAEPCRTCTRNETVVLLQGDALVDSAGGIKKLQEACQEFVGGLAAH